MALSYDAAMMMKKTRRKLDGALTARATIPALGHKIYPYLLRNLVIGRANQVWASDITYIPIGRGFLYHVAIIH